MGDRTAGQPHEDLPNLVRTLGATLRSAFTSDPRLAVTALSLTPIGWVTGALIGLWLKLLVDGAVARDTTAIVVAVVALVANQGVAWAGSIVGRRLGQTFREKAGVDLETQLIRASAGTNGVQHLERPEYVDKLDPLRKETWIVHWTLESFAETLGAVAQGAVTVVLLASIHPALLLLPAFGIPALLVGRAAGIRERNAEEAMGEQRRRQRHLVSLGTSSSPGKEIRVFALERRMLALSRDAWRREHALRTRVAWKGAGWQAAASAFFAVGFVGALTLVGQAVVAGEASVGDLALALVLAATMSSNLDLLVGMFHWLVGCLAVGARFLWLVDRARDEDRHRAEIVTRGQENAVPVRLSTGIELRAVTFHYPGTDRTVLDKVSLTLPAGAVVALVGDNGAGKTTLVKLLCGMYEPSGGTILADGHDLRAMDLRAWRSRCTGAFQDHARFELTVRDAVALGALDRRDDPAAVDRALVAAGGGELAAVLPRGLDTQLGATWPGGTELSGGQWQKVSLARGLMREEPLLTVLDEPTASLDAPTEDALFSRYAAEARRRRGSNGVTLLVSHRFSTVRSADLIVVLADGGVAEQGTHAALMRGRGTYAQLYELQARGYR